MQIATIRRRSAAHGPGVRYCVFFQGCKFGCPGCKYIGTWSSTGGFSRPVNKILCDIKHTNDIDGVTLSGGEPFLQWQSCTQLVMGVKKQKRKLNLWVYTGYTYEQVCAKRNLKPMLPYIDVLVDGLHRFDMPCSEDSWCGSTNQRLIDVQESLKQDSVVLWNDMTA